MHGTTCGKGSEVDGGKSDAVDHGNNKVFGFGVVAGCFVPAIALGPRSATKSASVAGPLELDTTMV